jgi:serine/threonine protein kinase
MNSESWQRVKQLLDEALAVDPSEQTSFLDRSCAGDGQLRREVESLLASHEQAGTKFLKVPAADLTAIGSALVRESRRVGVYEIMERIGHGGMGEVYRAVRADGQYTKDVAIKLVRGGYDTGSMLERFRNERQILASLDHPNIARLLDGGTTDDGTPYLVMELIDGKPIDRFCDDHRLSVTERLRLFRQVCAGVHYAHQRLVIHRDIKPSNVLVTKEGEPKLLDFGVAKIMAPIHEAQTTMTQAMTPEYASPEQIRGEPITTATDVYSLGVVLYRLLTGRSPYAGDTRSPHRLAEAVCGTDPERPSTVVVKPQDAPDTQPADLDRISSTREGSPAKLQRRLAGDLDDILLMALRKEAARRYGSVEQFAEDVRRHLEGLPVAARKGSWSYQAEKFVRRHRVAIAAAAVLILAVAGGVGATIREARIARANARRAEARFNDVRHLANSLIFDVDKSIADLPGSTPARKLLADDALQYLDTLAREAKGDLTLQRELATAYQKLGEIQGNPALANLGDTGAALESYRKAVAIRQALADANPGNKNDQVALAFAYVSLGSLSQVVSGNLQEALAEETKAQSILEPLAKADPNDLKVLDRLRDVYAEIGDIEGGNGSSANLANVESALENHRKALMIAERFFRERPNDASARLTLAIDNSNVAGDLVKKGDRVAALNSYQKARDILQSLAESSPPAAYKHGLGIMYQRIGNVQMMDGDSASAMKNYRARLEITEKLAAADPKNVSARLDVADSYAFAGLAAAESGDETEGLAMLQKAIDILEKETARDPKMSFARRLLGLFSVFH